MSSVPAWAWTAFAVLVLACLVVDLLAHRHHVPGRRSAVFWTLGWVAVAALFGAAVSAVLGPDAGIDYFTAYLLEKSLSVDNVVVFLVVFGALGIPQHSQRRVLTWGVFGALITRGLFIFVGAAVLERWHWLLYVFGALLVFAGAKMLRPEKHDAERPSILRFLERHLRWTQGLRGERFLVKEKGAWLATPLLMALIAIESADIVFALDSLPAAFSVTEEPFLIYSSNAFAMLGMRSLYVVLADTLAKLRYLRLGLAATLVFVGLKMVANPWVHVPHWLSLAIVVVLVGASVGASLLADRARPRKATRPITA